MMIFELHKLGLLVKQCFNDGVNERMKIIILNSPEDVAKRGAKIIIDQVQMKPDSVLGLATGSTPVALYKKLIKANQESQVSFSQTKSFNLDEYLGLEPDHHQSYRHFMQQNLFNHIDIGIENTHFPNSNDENPKTACDDYEQLIEQCGGVDLQLLGIGRNGHIGFNEPSSSLVSRTRVKALTKETIDDNARFFSKDEVQPKLSITMGIGTIMQASSILLLATGKSKAGAIKAAVEGSISASCPASILQMHPNVDVVIDEAASQQLKNQQFYIDVETENEKLMASLEGIS